MVPTLKERRYGVNDLYPTDSATMAEPSGMSPKSLHQTVYSFWRLCPETVPGDYGQRLCPETVPGECARRLCPETVPGDCARRLCPETVPADCARRLCPQ